jgi:putative component of toxin-antitoxin plasmid stabilization module
MEHESPSYNVYAAKGKRVLIHLLCTKWVERIQTI